MSCLFCSPLNVLAFKNFYYEVSNGELLQAVQGVELNGLRLREEHGSQCSVGFRFCTATHTKVHGC